MYKLLQDKKIFQVIRNQWLKTHWLHKAVSYFKALYNNRKGHEGVNWYYSIWLYPVYQFAWKIQKDAFLKGGELSKNVNIESRVTSN